MLIRLFYGYRLAVQTTGLMLPSALKYTLLMATDLR